MDYLNFPQKTAYHGVASVEEYSDHTPPPAQYAPAQHALPQYVSTAYDPAPYEVAQYDPALSPPATYERPGYKRKSSALSELIQNRAWWKTVLVQVVALAWLAPMGYLLYLNGAAKIIGASAWCPDGNCDSNMFSINKNNGGIQNKLGKYDKDDHNLLGALQLVAKALEIWFCLIAAALVYLITMSLASKPEGLPIGYLFRPNEFSEMVGLLDPLLYTSLKSGKSRPPLKPRIYIFIAFTAFLGLLCNLMGPAVAVLLLPALQWRETPKIDDQVFGSWNAAEAPSTAGTAFATAQTYSYSSNCTQQDFDNGYYSCASYPWGSQLDALVANSLAAMDASSFTSVEKAITFSFNTTYRVNNDNSMEDVIYWTPPRQLLDDITIDAYNVVNISLGTPASEMKDPTLYETYAQYNKSVQLLINRSGPILGAVPAMNVDFNNTYDWEIPVDADRQIRCYAQYNLTYTTMAEGASGDETYTKCVSYGKGWNPLNDVANFSVAGLNGNPGVDVEVFSSDRAAFLPNNELPPGLSKSCLYYGRDANNQTCDWDLLWASSNPRVANRTSNVTTIEFKMGPDREKDFIKLSVDFVAVYNFSEVTLDPYPNSNPLSLVQTAYLPEEGTAVMINPNWVLAAWAADRYGILQPQSSRALFMLDVMQYIYNTQSYDIINDYAGLADYLSFLTVMQTLSLVDYNIAEPGQTTPDDMHPTLQRWGRMYVWAYGITSRTGWLGLGVAILGCIVTITQFVFGIVSRREYRSPTQLLVSALENESTDAFLPAGTSEREIARVPFRVKETEVKRRASTFEFHGVSHSASSGIEVKYEGQI